MGDDFAASSNLKPFVRSPQAPAVEELKRRRHGRVDTKSAVAEDLGAVVIGAYTKGKLTHYGYAGSFSEKGLKEAVD